MAKVCFSPVVPFGNTYKSLSTENNVKQSKVQSPINFQGGFDDIKKDAIKTVNADILDAMSNKENLNDVDLFNKRLNDERWIKNYSKDGDFVHMKVKGMYDGTEYELKPNGTVTQVGTWQKPKVIMEENEDVAKYVVGLKGAEVAITTPQVSNNLANEPVLPEKKHTSFKEKMANVWKFFATADQMMVSSVKGIAYGLVTGASIMGGSWLFNTLPKAFAKEGPKFMEILKHPIKNISKSGKVMAGLGGIAVLAYHLVTGKMQANQRTAVIDHKLNTGHRDA